jgi:hypothetical protein
MGTSLSMRNATPSAELLDADTLATPRSNECVSAGSTVASATARSSSPT